MSDEDILALLTRFNNACEICLKPGRVDRDFVVDHDHKTGKVRGLLCHHCNTMLGLAKDNPSILSAGAFYLLKHGNWRTSQNKAK